MTPRMSSFTSWNLTEQEENQGSLLTLAQKAMIQNQICAAAEEKISLTFDPTNPSKFLQQEAELQGKILSLKSLLFYSEEVEVKLNQSHINLDD